MSSKENPFLCVCGLILLTSVSFANNQPDHPNILFIAVDDLRPELACYGTEEVVSPNIDRLASEGTLFAREYCQIPVCGASRASLMTGLYPSAGRFLSYRSRADEDAPGVVDLAGWLKLNGYTTLSNGKVYHTPMDNAASWDYIDQGKNFKVYLNPEIPALPENQGPASEAEDVADEAYPTGKMTQKIIKDLQRAKAEGTPFFITAGFTKPHLFFIAPKKYWDLYDREAIELAHNSFAPKGSPQEALHNSGELRNQYGGIPKDGPLSDELARTLINGYRACVSCTDAMICKLLAELDRLEMRNDTIIILWGDHGWQLGEHSLWCKHTLFKTSLNAPLIISAPGKKEGQTVTSLVEFVDIYPTLCELAGLELPGHPQGKSLVPLLDDPLASFKEAVFSRYLDGDSVRTDRFHHAEWTNGSKMLYDHTVDPDENENIAGEPQYRDVVGNLAEVLKAHRESLREPVAERGNRK